MFLSEGFVVSRVGIRAGNDTAGFGFEVPRDVRVDGFQRFPVSVPGNGESDEDVLGVV